MIAAVTGFAMGGGCEIALVCHLVVADWTAQFALSEVKAGLVAGASGLIRLPRTTPQGGRRDSPHRPADHRDRRLPVGA